jgi:hypothetical protein
MTIEQLFASRREVFPRAALLAVVTITSMATTLQSQEMGGVQGGMTVDGEPIELKYSYVYAEEDPFNEGEVATVIKLTTEEVAAHRVESPFSGGSSLSVSFDAQGEVYSRNIFLRTDEGTQSLSFSGTPDFRFSLEQSGPDEYRGTIQGTVDQLEFSLSFAAAPFPETGTPLPPDGGEPGKAYLALVEIMSSGDMDKIRAIAPKKDLDEFVQMGLSDEDVLEFLALLSPSEVKIVGGTIDGDTAFLEVEMVMGGEPGSGTITMEIKDGRWVKVSEAWKM